jgi:hypothetical protein
VLLSDGEPDGAKPDMLKAVSSWAAKGNMVNTVYCAILTQFYIIIIIIIIIIVITIAC